MRAAAAAVAVVLVALTAPAAGADTTSPWGAEQARPAPVTVDAAPVSARVTRAAATGAGTWRFDGAGWGHGVGMSQYGAMEMARDGASAAEILGHYYTGTDYEVRSDTQRISVNLQHGVSSTTLASSALSGGGGTMTLQLGDATLTATAGQSATVTRSGGSVRVSCAACAGGTSAVGPELTAVWDDGRTLLAVGGAVYRDGSLVVTPTPSASTLEVVARVRIHDEYLDYIREVPWSWPAAALEAQAAAARGYALRAYSGGLKASCNCHVYDTTASQVFGGYPSTSEQSAWQSWRDAVRSAGSGTQGFVATYGGAVIESLYSSSSGGRTQNSEDVFTAAVPYLRSVDDPWSLRPGNPRASWTFRPARSTVAGAFGLTDVVRVDLTDRFDSGAVATATATSSGGSRATVSGAALASRLGLYSTYVQHPWTRYGGTDRYGVAAAVASSRLSSASTVVVASGEDAARADAAVSGPLAQALAAPLLLSTADRLPAATRSELDRRSGSLTSAVVVGGPASVGPTVVAELEARGLSVTRIGGADRYAVSAAAARRVAAAGAVSAVVVASGSGLADALAAGGPAGAEGEPILLTRASDLPPSVGRAVDDLGVRSVRLLGGTSSVSARVEEDLRTSGTGGPVAVTRLGGADRYAVAASVASFYRSRLASVTAIAVASGSDAALTDALTAGSTGRITVLVRPTGVPWATADTVQRSEALARLDVIGGPSSVPDAVAVAAARS